MSTKRDIGGGDHKLGCFIPTLFFSLSILSFYQGCNNQSISGQTARRNSSYMSQKGVKMTSKPEEVKPSTPYHIAEQKRIIEASKSLSKYKNQIKNNAFINQVDLEIKEGLYEGYDIEYFYFHEFQTNIVDHFYQLFFENYDYFTLNEQKQLLKTAKDDEYYTWNSKKKELAIYGNHLSLLANSLGEESHLFERYKQTYLETQSIFEAVNSLPPKTLRNNEFSFEGWEKIEGRKFSKKQEKSLAQILFAE